MLLGDGRPFLERVLADPPEFVFNIAEGMASAATARPECPPSSRCSASLTSAPTP